MSSLDQPHFKDDTAAREYLEAIRWPEGPVCPHCGVVDNATLMKGKSHRPGLWKCKDCRQPFTVTVGTLFERSKIPLHKWFIAVFMLCSSKKGMSSHQLHRMLGVTYKTAWFMTHRIREAMREGVFSPFGGPGGTVEVDETFIGKKKGEKVRYGYEHKHKVLALVDRETGRARSMVVKDLNTKTVAPIVRQNVTRETRLMTDEARHYVKVGREYSDHQVVRHSAGEYGRGDAHTNTIEGFFSIFKRGMKGVYQHCGEKHLHRYLAEFDFRYNERKTTDIERTDAALRGITGRRLTYEGPASRQASA